MTYPLAKHFDKISGDVKEYTKGISSDDNKLMYGLLNQAMHGDNTNTTEIPSFYQITEKGQWNSWNDQKGKSADRCKQEYAELALKYFPEDIKKQYYK